MLAIVQRLVVINFLHKLHYLDCPSAIPLHWTARLMEYFVFNICNLDYHMILRYLRSIALGWTYDTPNYDFTVDLINEFKNKVAKGLATPKVTITTEI